jgi:plasmid stabilization system protein ParE
VTAEAARIAVIWAPEARADLRAIDRETAMQPRRRTEEAQSSPHRFSPPLWRVFFDHKSESTIDITAVRNRREAYR